MKSMLTTNDDGFSRRQQVTTQPFVVSQTSRTSRTGSNPQNGGNDEAAADQQGTGEGRGGRRRVVGVGTHMADSLPDFVESIKAMVDVVGVDHAGIETDTDLLSARGWSGHQPAWPAATGGFFPVVVGELLRQGIAPNEVISVAGGNFCRVFGQATAGRA